MKTFWKGIQYRYTLNFQKCCHGGRLNVKKYFNFVSIFLIISLLPGCSYFSKRARIDSNGNTQNNVTNESVPKFQYDDLSKKYEDLLSKYRDLEGKNSKEAPTDLVETVNVLDENLKTSTSQIASNSKTTENSQEEKLLQDALNDEKKMENQPTDGEVESEILSIRKAQELVKGNKLNDALAILKDLENSKVLQIKVRVKFAIGEIMLLQKEYDLAMQIFEEIVSEYAFSGVVVETLDRLVTCADKLGQGVKKEKYYSMLHDVFGVQ